MMSRCLINLAIRALQEGRWPLAQERLERAAELMRRVGDTANEALAAYNRADLAIRQGRFDAAEDLLGRGRALRPHRRRRRAPRAGPSRDGQGTRGAGPGGRRTAAFAEAATALLAVGLPHEVVDIEAGLADCAALEGDLERVRTTAVAAIGTATQLGHETALGDLHCLVGACSCGRAGRRGGRAGVRARAGSAGRGRGRLRERPQPAGPRPRPPGAGEPQDGEDLDTALAKLGELGVEVLPHGLRPAVARGCAHIVPRMSVSNRTSSSRSPALSRWLAT